MNWVTLKYKAECTWKEYLFQKRRRNLKQEIIRYYTGNHSDNEEILSAVAYLQRHPLNTFPAPFAEKYKEEDIVVEKDSENGLLYIVQEGKRLYFKRSYNAITIKKLYSGLKMEQDMESPHCYMASKFAIEAGDTFFDIGCAEGNMALTYIEKVDHLVLFERDKEWLEALQATFAPWKNKVTIVDRYVSDVDDEINVSIDNFLKTYPHRPNFIKVDVEGAEERVLTGMKELLSQPGLKIALCTYHRQGDYDYFTNKFAPTGAQVMPSKGVMLFLNDIRQMKPPYFRKGLIRITTP